MQRGISPGQVGLTLDHLPERASRATKPSTPIDTAPSKRHPITAKIMSIPSYFFVAFAVLAVLLTISIVGSYYYIQGQANANKDAALNIARGESKRLCVSDQHHESMDGSHASSISETVSGRAMERLLDNQKAPIYEVIDQVTEVNT